ncbi:MAG: hypothetical protein ACKVKT_07395, partial [Rhodospirillales bacterium]
MALHLLTIILVLCSLFVLLFCGGQEEFQRQLDQPDAARDFARQKQGERTMDVEETKIAEEITA